MFTAYLKYIGLLLFSGLILTFYRITIFSVTLSVNSVKAVSAITVGKQQHKPFSLLEDVILPLFPVLDTADRSPDR